MLCWQKLKYISNATKVFNHSIVLNIHKENYADPIFGFHYAIWKSNGVTGRRSTEEKYLQKIACQVLHLCH